jgi:dienelactone hydrolase
VIRRVVVKQHRALAIGFACLAILFTAATLRRDLHGFSLVYRAADRQGQLRRIADLDTVPITERLMQMPGGRQSFRARIYAPVERSRQTVLLVSGLHPGGIDEPRLVDLAQKLAHASVTVVTPDIPELSRFEITPALTDRIEDAAVWLASSPLAASRRIGLMGVSFSGGLSVVAAGRPSLRDRLLYVLSFGGHNDLLNVLGYFCQSLEHTASGQPRPHDYGVAIVLLSVARELVPAAQVTPLTDAVRRFLWASYLTRIDQEAAAREFAAVRALETTMGQPASTLLHYVNERDVEHLGPLLVPYLDAYAGAAALSPAQSPLPSAPVFLLHGREDNVIPSSESKSLARRLQGRAPVRLLLTDLISHADPDQPAHLVDVLRLFDFWGDLLSR